MDIHIKTQSNKKQKAVVVFHFTTPDEDNAAGITLANCLKDDLVDENVKAPFLDLLHTDDINNGIIYEHEITVEFNANITLVEKQNIIKAKHTALQSIVENKIRNVYQFYGREINAT